MNRAEKINERLKQMTGKTFSYAKGMHYVAQVEVSEMEQEFTIRTNINKFVRKFESFENFMQYWMPIEQINQVPAAAENNSVDSNNAVVVLVEKENALADDMITILRDNIAKVQQSPAYIDQAKAINNNINSVINIMKLKMAFVKETKRKK